MKATWKLIATHPTKRSVTHLSNLFNEIIRAGNALKRDGYFVTFLRYSPVSKQYEVAQ